jgi:hydrogenase nickel incorporation protein HypB
MVTRALSSFAPEGSGVLEETDLLILENIGNLVCPAEFDTGAHRNVMILSVPEGDDKPLKYPLMFTVSDLVLISKIDTLDFFDFDLDKARERILRLNPNAEILPVSAKTGEGIDAVCDWVREVVKKNGRQ